jgi:cobaltochelatase CobT
MRAIEGITALCLGSAGRVLWMDHTDAAAFGDGERIYLSRPTGQHEQEYELLVALALREIAKLWYTDPSVFAMANGAIPPFAAVVEEVRLKAQVSRDFLGAPGIFNQAVAIATIIHAERARQTDTDLASLQLLTIWAAGHEAWLATPQASGSRATFEAMVRPRTDPAKLQQAIDLARQAPVLDSSREAAELGASIQELLQQSQPEAGDSPQGTGPGQPQDPDPKTDSLDRDQPGQAPGSASQDAQSADVPGHEKSEQGGSTHAGSEKDSASATQEPGVSDPLSDAVAMLRGHPGSRDRSSMAQLYRDQAAPAEPVPGAAMNALRLLLEAPEFSMQDLVEAALADCGGAGTDSTGDQGGLAASLGAGGGEAGADGEAGRTLLPGVAGKLVTVLLRALQALRRRPFLFSAAGARIATSRLWRLKQLGDTRIFRKKAGEIGIDAAIAVLLDRSASMKRHGFEQAVELTQAFLLALQRINGVRTSLDIFPGTHTASEEVLAFGQNVAASRERLAAVEPGGGTPMGSAIAHRLRLLLGIHAERKLMVVITDGRPDDPQLALAQAVIAQAGAAGVQVIGVGIGVEIGHLFPASVSVGSVTDLPDALAALFRDELAQRLAEKKQ